MQLSVGQNTQMMLWQMYSRLKQNPSADVKGHPDES